MTNGYMERGLKGRVSIFHTPAAFRLCIVPIFGDVVLILNKFSSTEENKTHSKVILLFKLVLSTEKGMTYFCWNVSFPIENLN